jgi:hypothetical protein
VLDQKSTSVKAVEGRTPEAGPPRWIQKLIGGRIVLLECGSVINLETTTHYRLRSLKEDDFPLLPLALSPDEVSFAFLVKDGDGPGVVVYNFAEDKRERIVIDRKKMPFIRVERRKRGSPRETINSSWLAHYFQWQRQTDGFYHLVPK